MFTTEEGARRYQEVLVPLMFAPSARRLVAEAKLPAGAHVLDVATGTGIVARTAAEAIGSTGRVTAVDATESMLAIARSQPSPPGAAPIEYLQSTIEDASLPTGTYHAAFCQQALQFFEDPAHILGYIRQALRPEGRLYVALWGSESEHPLTMAMQRALIECQLNDFTWFLTKVHRLHNPALVSGVLRQGGFIVESHRKVDLTPDGTWHASDGRRLLAATPLAAKLADLTPEKRTELGDACERQLENFTKDGTPQNSELDLHFAANFYIAKPA
jgi:2-polyprenyl-3-methyl-5-hydroxy-6-metoxy-1,4-benzoquinol methylase